MKPGDLVEIIDYGGYYVVIVNGKNLGVPLRFLHRVETQ